MKSAAGLVWRLLLMGLLFLWVPVALLYGITQAELPEEAMEQSCSSRQQIFSPEAWHAGEDGSPWWHFTSACNYGYSLVPDWWILAVVLPALLFLLVGADILRGGPRRARTNPDARV